MATETSLVWIMAIVALERRRSVFWSSNLSPESVIKATMAVLSWNASSVSCKMKAVTREHSAVIVIIMTIAIARFCS